MQKARVGSLRLSEWLVVSTCLCLFAAQAALSSLSKSASFDEEYHLTAGYAYLLTGDFRLNTNGPPFTQALSALPLLLLPEIVLPLGHPAWADANYPVFAKVFLWEVNTNPHKMLVLARLPVIAFGVLLAGAIFAWARRRYGVTAGWIALALAAFDPNLIANSRLVTADLGVTLFLFLAFWRWARWLERPSAKNLVAVGVLVGMAMTTKYSGLLFWPIAGLIAVIYPGDAIWRRLPGLIAAVLVAYSVVWAVYRFDFGMIPGAAIPFPAPFYLYGLSSQYSIVENTPTPSFLLGQVSQRGWWNYFLVALPVKTPLPLLILAAVGAVIGMRAEGWRRASIWWLPAAAFLAYTFTGRLSIGYRHILPIVPFMILMAAQSAAFAFRHWRAVMLFMLAWQVIGTARIFPHDEAFFNELVGGPVGGSRVLADSNLDWGQDLPALKQVLNRLGIDQVHLAYFGVARPELYGIRYKPLPAYLLFLAGPEVEAYNPFTPEPGWYAISLTSLQMGLLRQNNDIYDYFRNQQPVARAGYSINLYEVRYPDETPVTRTVITGRRVSDLSPEELGLKPYGRLIVKWAASPDTTIISPSAGFNPPDSEFYYSLSINFSGIYELIGYELERVDFAPAETIGITLYWQAGNAPVPWPAPSSGPPLASFVHVWDGGEQRIVAQYDGWGAALSGVEPGDIIVQHVSLSLPADAAPGAYQLTTGLYSPQTMGRFAAILPDGSREDAVELNEITIR